MKNLSGILMGKITSIITRSTAILTFAVCFNANSAVLEDGARIAIIGDSITEQKLYSRYMEAYLLACSGYKNLKVFQFGWGGETAGGFAGRLENDLSIFKPTIGTLCYGMNDGQYRPYVDEIGRTYEANMRRVIDGMKKIGVKTIVIGSPGAVDTKYFVRNNFAPLSGADGYNKNLATLRDICKKLAAEYNQPFADVHQPMIEAMKKAKAALGDDYDVCGRDGFHPGPNGHLIMAYAFLKALGCDGNIAQITIDMKGKPSVSAGHKILSASAGKVEIESARYPFCFDPDPRSSSSTRSIVPFFPFNEELNRFTLKVTNLGAQKATVKWRNQSKEFTREQLEAGINLAAEFNQTPFDETFQKILKSIGSKQSFETVLIKNLVSNFRYFGRERSEDPEIAKAFDTLSKAFMARWEKLNAEVQNSIVPVKHTIEIIPAQ